MKKGLILLSAFVVAGAGIAARAEMVEKIMVRVNDRLITNSEFQRRISAASHAPGASTDATAIKREVLQDLIKEKLLEERAKEMSVSAADEEIEAAVERVKRQYNLATDQEFDAALASSNMTREDLKRQMRQTIILQKVIGRDVTSKLEVSEDMLRLEYERQKDKLYRIPEQARVSEIVIRFVPGDAARRRELSRGSRKRGSSSPPGRPSSSSPRNTPRGTRATAGETWATFRRASSCRRSTRRFSAILPRSIRRRPCSRGRSTSFA